MTSVTTFGMLGACVCGRMGAALEAAAWRFRITRMIERRDFDRILAPYASALLPEEASSAHAMSIS